MADNVPNVNILKIFLASQSIQQYINTDFVTDAPAMCLQYGALI